MIFSRHPVSAALFMIVSMVSVAGLFVLLEAFFLAILQVLVYAGAVMVLFLFIIMLLDVGPEGSKSSRIKMISGLAGVACFSILTVLSLLLVIDSGPICESCSAWPALQDDLLVNGENLVFFFFPPVLKVLDLVFSPSICFQFKLPVFYFWQPW